MIFDDRKLSWKDVVTVPMCRVYIGEYINTDAVWAESGRAEDWYDALFGEITGELIKAEYSGDQLREIVRSYFDTHHYIKEGYPYSIQVSREWRNGQINYIEILVWPQPITSKHYFIRAIIYPRDIQHLFIV